MQLTFQIPYDPALNKNFGGRDKRYKDDGTTKAQNDIAWVMWSEGVLPYMWRDADIKVVIHVYRPRDIIDASNFQGRILDGIELGTGVDDKHYNDVTCKGFIDKVNPRIVVTLTQED